ncbi:Glycosyl transferase family 11 [Filimonas lacunae]|uniref:Glycosyl transferase family 11 n=1 Tax=Filimonas lacunae TaxID=477680 RepID=A0A173MS57_9BACT|nr:alpha-1,2-fucosyltransferase [Filimonas lacunae]BAV10231.1 alpha-1,2-fucosyltransferase [Filimonas lacunae]SIT18017.1 Glycosyl transferase family 11 [Filimonas lacunae]
MIGVPFKGRLGNLLFQYVYLQYLKSKHPGKTFFFPNPHHGYLTKYFDLGNFDNITLSSKLYSVYTRALTKVLPFKDVYVQNWAAPRERKIENWTIINGYFQSDWYYQQIPQKPALQLKEVHQQAFQNKFGAIFNNSKTLVVHIRRTDYMSYGKRDISLPMDYFKRQLDSIENPDQYQIFFVSDDMEAVKTYFPQKPNYHFSSNSEIIDFQLIMHADVAIISNSTFAWWAAYLSPKKNLVLAPKNWIGYRVGREHPRGIMTSKFTWRDVLVTT